MGLTVDVASGQLIQSAWGNEVRDRTLQVFANAAERTAQWPDRPNGAQSILMDMPDCVWLYSGGLWRTVEVETSSRSLTTTASGSFAITFNRVFSGAPAVVAACDGGTSAVAYGVGLPVALPTATGFSGYVRNMVNGTALVSSACRIHYHAGRVITSS